MKNKNKVSNRLKTVNRLRLVIGWFGMLTPVFGAGMLVGVGLTSPLSQLFIGQVVIVSAINYFVGRMLLKPVVVKKGVKRHG